MSPIRDVVAQKVDAIAQKHEALKLRSFGFLVRPVTLLVGWLVVIVGAVTIPMPGPGWVTVFVGIGILSLELHWAQRMLHWGIRKYEEFFDWYQRQSKSRRYGLIAASCACVWVTVGATILISWNLGVMPALNPIMEAMVPK